MRTHHANAAPQHGINLNFFENMSDLKTQQLCASLFHPAYIERGSFYSISNPLLNEWHHCQGNDLIAHTKIEAAGEDWTVSHWAVEADIRTNLGTSVAATHEHARTILSKILPEPPGWQILEIASKILVVHLSSENKIVGFSINAQTDRDLNPLFIHFNGDGTRVGITKKSYDIWTFTASPDGHIADYVTTPEAETKGASTRRLLRAAAVVVCILLPANGHSSHNEPPARGVLGTLQSVVPTANVCQDTLINCPKGPH